MKTICGLAIAVIVLVSAAGCGKPAPRSEDHPKAAKWQIVYLDNASNRDLQMQVNGSDAGVVPAGTWKRVRLPRGRHELVALAEGREVSRVVGELPKEQIGIFNPEQAGRYSVGGFREGTRAYQSGHTLVVETGPDQYWTGEPVGETEWVVVAADRPLERDFSGELPEETTKLYKRVPPELSVAAARYMLAGPREPWVAAELVAAVPILAADGAPESLGALVAALRGPYVEALDEAAAEALAQAETTALVDDLAAALATAMERAEPATARITRLGDLLGGRLTAAHVEAAAASKPVPAAWSALAEGLETAAPPARLAVAQRAIATNDPTAVPVAAITLNVPAIATDPTTISTVDDWVAALPEGEPRTRAEHIWNTAVAVQIGALEEPTAAQLERQAETLLPPVNTESPNAVDACIAKDNFTPLTKHYGELPETTRQHLIGDLRYVRSSREFTPAYKVFLLRALRDPVAEHRRHAAEILGSPYGNDADVLPPLLAMLDQERDERTRQSVRDLADMLTVRHVDSLADPVKDLLAVAMNPAGRQRAEALRKLAALRVPESRILDAVAAAFEDAPDDESRERLLYLLGNDRFASEMRCRLVLPLLASKDGDLRQQAFSRLATWIASDVRDREPYITVLENTVKAEPDGRRGAAMRTQLQLARIDGLLATAPSREAKVALAPQLAEYLGAEAEDVRERVMPWLAAAAENPTVREALSEHFDRIPGRFYGSLLSDLNSRAVRGEKAADPVVPVIRRGTRHPEAWIRRTAYQQLIDIVRYDTSTAGDSLLAILRAEIPRETDETVRQYLLEHLDEQLKYRR